VRASGYHKIKSGRTKLTDFISLSVISGNGNFVGILGGIKMELWPHELFIQNVSQ